MRRFIYSIVIASLLVSLLPPARLSAAPYPSTQLPDHSTILRLGSGQAQLPNHRTI